MDRDLDELAVNAAIAAKSVDKLGDQTRQAAADMRLLDQRIALAKKSTHDLGLEFARTGDAADSKAFSQEKALLARLERLKKMLTPDPEPLLPDSWMNKSVNLPFAPPVPAGAVAGGVAFAAGALPAISAGIAAAVIGGVGIGGVVGGALLAARDDRVKTAWEGLAHDLMTALLPVTDTFAQPIINSAKTFEDAFTKSGIVATLQDAVKLVEPLTAGLAGFVEQLGPGLASIIKQAAPVFDVLKRDLPAFGHALTVGLDAIGGSAKPAAIALHDFFTAMDKGINTTAFVAEGLAKIYPLIRPLTTVVPMFGLIGALADLNAAKSGMEEAPNHDDWLKRLEDESRGAASGVAAVGDAATLTWHAVNVYSTSVDRATAETQFMDAAMTEAYSTFLSFESASVASEAAIDKLADSLNRNGLNFNKDTEAGRENVTNLIDLAEKTEAATRKKLEETHSVEESAAVYDRARQSLYDMAIQAGATAGEAQALVDKWLALRDLQDLQKTFTINVKTNSQLAAYYAGTDNIFTKGFASGGDTPAGEPYWVGEQGPELAFPGGKSQYIATKDQMSQQWRGSTTWGGNDRTITVIVKDTSGRTLRSDLITDATDRNVDDATIRLAYP